MARKMFTVQPRTRSIKEAMDAVRKRGSQYDKAVMQVVHNAAIAIATQAKRNVRASGAIDRGDLWTSIQPELDTGKPSANVNSRLEYAAYVEFGTGRFAAAYTATRTGEERNYAKTFYKTGRGRMRSRPFLFPALDSLRASIVQKLRSIPI